MTPLPGAVSHGIHADPVQALARRLEGFERQLRELAPSIAKSVSGIVADLTTAQADLAANVADITAAQSDITTLISQVVVASSFYNHATGFAVSNTYSTKASVTLTVPAGFTKAVVSATAHVRILNNSGGAASFSLVASINGNAGPVITDSPAAGQYGNAAVTYSALVSGLTGGGTFTVATRTYSSPALSSDAGNEATCNGTVLWFR